MGVLQWLKKRRERQIEATALALLRSVDREHGEWIFDTMRAPWETLAIERGWLEKRRRHANGAAYYVTDEGRAALLRAGDP